MKYDFKKKHNLEDEIRDIEKNKVKNAQTISSMITYYFKLKKIKKLKINNYIIKIVGESYYENDHIIKYKNKKIFYFSSNYYYIKDQTLLDNFFFMFKEEISSQEEIVNEEIKKYKETEKIYQEMFSLPIE